MDKYSVHYCDYNYNGYIGVNVSIATTATSSTIQFVLLGIWPINSVRRKSRWSKLLRKFDMDRWFHYEILTNAHTNAHQKTQWKQAKRVPRTTSNRVDRLALYIHGLVGLVLYPNIEQNKRAEHKHMHTQRSGICESIESKVFFYNFRKVCKLKNMDINFLCTWSGSKKVGKRKSAMAVLCLRFLN